MFDGKVLRVMENSDGLAVEGGIEVITVGAHGAVWRDWDGVEGNRLRGDAGHNVARCNLEWFAECGLGSSTRGACALQRAKASVGKGGRERGSC